MKRALLTLVKFEEQNQLFLDEDGPKNKLQNFDFVLNPEIHLNLRRPERKFQFLPTSTDIGRYWAVLADLARISNLDMLVACIWQEEPDETTEDEWLLRKLVLLSDIFFGKLIFCMIHIGHYCHALCTFLKLEQPSGVH